MSEDSSAPKLQRKALKKDKKTREIYQKTAIWLQTIRKSPRR